MLITYHDAQGNPVTVDNEKTLIHGHPDLTPTPVEADRPQFVPARSFHQPTAKAEDWHTKKAKPATGYSSEIDNPEWIEKYGYKRQEGV
ncbi:MAG: hypothetical protein WCC22_20825 [Terriglobales bacterium]